MYSLSGYFDFDRNFTSDDLPFRNQKTESFHMKTIFFHVGVITLIPFLSRHIYMQKVLYPHILLYYVFIVRTRYEVIKSESGNVCIFMFPDKRVNKSPNSSQRASKSFAHSIAVQPFASPATFLPLHFLLSLPLLSPCHLFIII